MATLRDLKDQVFSILQVKLNIRDDFQGEAEDIDLVSLLDKVFMTAANNARLWAERSHDFTHTLVSVNATVDSSGRIFMLGQFDDLQVSGTLRKLKTLNQIYLKSDEGLLPIQTISRKLAGRRAQISNDLETYSEWDRYPGDSESSYGSYQLAIHNGSWMTFQPELAEGTELVLDGYAWLDPYTSLSAEDFLVEWGFDFMQWQIILELNYLLQVFVPRVEGSLQPPEKMRDLAWLNLVEWDSHLYDGQLQPDIR